MIINKSNAMSTVKKKQSNNGSNSTIKNDSTQSSESKFTGEPQSNLDSSDSGQSYMSVDGTPFAIVKREEKYVIVLGVDIISARKFNTIEEAEAYIKEKPWPLLWATAMWIMMNQKMIKTKLEIKK